MKVCTKCGEEKPATVKYFLYRKQRSALSTQCRVCTNKYRRTRRYHNLRRTRQQEASYREQMTVRQRENRAYVAYLWQIDNKYSLTEQCLRNYMDKQGGCCAICKGSLFLPEDKSVFAIDHCHTTGLVRGLLCSDCNIALGKFKDNINSLNNAVIYLTEEI